MHGLLAALVVFLCSAAVLTVEIIGGRLMAPYVGVSLETYTSVIGIVLAGIAAGSWLGGRVADRLDARRLIGPTVIVGGMFTLLTVPIVRSVGDSSSVDVGLSAAGLALAAFFVPAVVLSAVNPMVVKLQLRDLGSTGNTVGRLSAVGTSGGLVGVFFTGFVLVENVPTRTIIYGVGIGLIVLGLGLGIGLVRRDAVPLAVLVITAGSMGTSGLSTTEPCEVESAYFCMRVEQDPAHRDGRTLWLDNLPHSYVDLSDPIHLDFFYVRAFASVVDATFDPGRPVSALHIGGGGFTFPRWLETTRPSSDSTVLEIDPAVVELAKRRLGLRESPQLRVRVGDARLAIRSVDTDSVNLVVGDAFGGLSVPWHLTTTEFMTEVRRVLTDDGLYVVNVIDGPPFLFARAELRTMRERFGHVAAVAPPGGFSDESADNVVLVASDATLPDEHIAELVDALGSEVLEGRALERFVGDVPIITDDRAPVDQWLARGRI